MTDIVTLELATAVAEEHARAIVKLRQRLAAGIMADGGAEARGRLAWHRRQLAYWNRKRRQRR
jgi:hypothetical protein